MASEQCEAFDGGVSRRRLYGAGGVKRSSPAHVTSPGGVSGMTGTKLLASSLLPLPVYFASNG